MRQLIIEKPRLLKTKAWDQEINRMPIQRSHLRMALLIFTLSNRSKPPLEEAAFPFSRERISQVERPQVMEAGHMLKE